MKAKHIGFALAAAAVATAGTVYAKWDDWVELPRVRAGIISTLKDPASATFRQERLRGDTVCGEVNSRNSLGGYVGFKRYVSTPMRSATEETGTLHWLPADAEAAKARGIDRTITFMRQQGRQPTAEEHNLEDFAWVWSNYCG